MSCMIAVASLSVCCTILLVSFPSGRMVFHEEIIGDHIASRTVVYRCDRVADIFHFTVHALDLVIDPCHFVVYAVCERQ